MKTRYLLCPGLVRSKTDGDWHNIGARNLAMLYGIRMDECVVMPEQRPANHHLRMHFLERVRDGELTAIYPREDGKYPIFERSK